MRFILGLGIGSLVLIVMAGLLSPIVLHSHKPVNSTRALSNVHQIGLALADFDSDYGKFPDASTIGAVKSTTGTAWDLKDRTSNDLFKQLFAAGIVSSEEIFYARVPGAKKPDNVISPAVKILEARECGFAYIPGASSRSNPSTPVVVAPLIPGTLKFDPVPFEGQAVVLRADGIAVLRNIESDGRVLTPQGKDIFDPHDAYWSGVVPDVKWAER